MSYVDIGIYGAIGADMAENHTPDFDIDAFLNQANAHAAKVDELHKVMPTLIGRAQDEDNLVTVEFDAQGVRDLILHPKAMRLSSGELAERIKETIREATADLNEQMSQAMSEVFGEEHNPMKFVNDPEAALKQVHEAQAAYDRTFQDEMAELDRIKSRLGL
jgi:hypothetical protein